MKKLQLLLTALLSIVSAVAMADEVTVGNIEADAGGNAEIVVNLSTAATNITGYQMSLYLPEGVTLQTDEDDDYVYTLSGRHHSSHSLSINNQADGGLMLICYSMNKKCIAAGDGELLRLPVNIAPEAAGTALEVELRSVKLSDTGSNVTTLPDVSFSITVQYALEAYAVVSTSETTLTYYYDRLKHTRTGTVYSFSNFRTSETDGWAAHRTTITNVVFDESFGSYESLTSTAYWFHGFSSLTTITGIQYLKTINVTNMSYMFYGCSSLTSLNLTYLNTANVVNTSYMFYNCTTLVTINVSNTWVLTNVTISNYMFYGCVALLGGDDTAFDENITDKTKGYAGVGGYLTMEGQDGILMAYAVLNNSKTTLTFYYDRLKHTRTGTIYTVSNFRTGETDGWAAHRTTITNVVFDESFGSYEALTSTAYWFHGFSSLTTITGIQYLKTVNVTNMSYMFHGCSSLTSLDLTHFSTANVTNMSYMFYNCSTLVTINVSNTWVINNVSVSNYMFYGCVALLGGDDTAFDSSSTDISKAFAGIGGYLTMEGQDGTLVAYAVLSADKTTLTYYYDRLKHTRTGTIYTVSNFRTGETDGWAAHRTTITNVVFDESFGSYGSLTSTAYWFHGFSSLTTITGIQYLKTVNVTNMSYMFHGCSSLTSLDLTHFSTANVTNMSYMFYNCTKLVTVNVSNTWVITNVSVSNYMFYGCVALLGGDDTAFDASSTDISKAFAGIGGYLTMEGQDGTLVAYAVLSADKTTLTYYYDRLKHTRTGTIYTVSNFRTGETDGWAAHRTTITNVVFDESFGSYEALTSTAYWFHGFSSLTTITGIQYLKTVNVTNMSYMFHGCSSLTSLDLTHFSTANVTNMSYMFYNCSTLVTINVSNTWVITNVSVSNYMFYGCVALLGGDDTAFDASSTDISKAFAGIGGYLTMEGQDGTLVAYAVLSADKTALTYYYDRLKHTRTGTIYTVSNFRTGETDGWAAHRTTITNVVFDESFGSYGSLTSTAYWFHGFSSLTTITGIQYLKTVNVTNMSYMFHGCSSLTSLDLTHFSTANVTNMSYMFYNCTKLVTINVSNTWVINNVSVSNYMFYGCVALLGNDTAYDESSTDISKAYAGTGGYLTLKDDSQGGDEPSDVEVTDISELDNIIYLGNVEINAGKQVALSIRMKNSAPIRGFQFNLYLPDGVTPACDTDGNIQCVLTADRREAGNQHTIKAHLQADGSYLFLCGSQQFDTFTGNDGEVATMLLNISNNLEVGEYPMVLRYIKLTETDIANFYESDNIVSKLTIVNYEMGDISGDGKVDVSDYIGVANYILNYTPDGFNDKAADVNKDQAIDVLDYIGIANIILTGSIYGDSNVFAASRRGSSMNLSELENVIYIEPFIAQPGVTEFPVSIKMKNTAPIRGFQFDLTLPEGVTPATEATGTIKCSLTADRRPEGDHHTISVSHQAGNTYRFLCGSLEDEKFTGTDGEIATLLVNIASDIEEGDYTLSLTEIKLTETNIDNAYVTDLLETTLTITSERVILDETSLDVPEAANGVNVLVKRTVKKDEWNTICLPFAMTATQCQAAFGDGVQIADFTGVDTAFDDNDNVVGITAHFSPVTAIEANRPYVIKTSLDEDVTAFTVDNVTIVPDEDEAYFEFDNGLTGKKYQFYSGFYGTYHANTEVPENCLFLSGNKFWYSKGATKMKAFRAYFEFYDVLTEVENASARVAMSFDETTSISEKVIVNSEDFATAVWYTLDGRKLGKKPIAKGVYINNGHKIVIK